MPRLYDEDDEQLDDEQEVEETEDEEEDDLSDLDEETRERLERQMARQEQKHLSELRKREEAVQGVGLSFDGQGRVAIGDLSRASSYFAPLAQSRREAEQESVRHTPEVRPQEEEDEEWVDPSYDSEKFQKQLANRIAKETSKYEQALQGMQQFFVEDKIEQAMEKVEAAVEKHAPYLSAVIEHPQFEETMRQVLGNMPMSSWRTSQNLAQVVGMVGPQLGTIMPKKSAKTQEPSVQERARSTVNRSTLSQSAPSKSLSSGKGREYSDEDKYVAERLGIPLEEAWALGQDSQATAYRQVKNAAKNGRR